MLEPSKWFKGGYAFRRSHGTPKPIVEDGSLPKKVVISLKKDLEKRSLPW